MAVRRAEVAGEPLSPDGGLELGDSAFEFLFFGRGDVVVASAAAAGWHGGFELEKEIFHLGVLRGGRRGDSRQGALNDFVAMRCKKSHNSDWWNH